MKKKQLFLRNILIVLHILFAIVGLSAYLATYRLSENLLIQKTLNKQLILAKTGSLAARNLIRNVQSDLASFTFSFAKVDEAASIDREQTRTAFANYMQRSELPVSGIALFDENGKVSILENRSHIQTGEGEDFSQAGFIKWSRNPVNKGKIFISTPLLGTVGASKGKIILVVAKPLYFGNKFKGTLAIRLRIEDFTKAYIIPLGGDSSEDAFIVNAHGVVIAGRDTLLDKNLFDWAKSQKWHKYNDFISQLSLALKNNDTQTIWTFQLPKEDPREMLVGMSRIDIPDTDEDLYLKVATPKDGVTLSLSGLKKYGFFWLGFGVITTIIGSLLVIRLQSSQNYSN